MSRGKRPVHELVLTWDPAVPTESWRSIAFVTAGAVLECARALHRIAAALERKDA